MIKKPSELVTRSSIRRVPTLSTHFETVGYSNDINSCRERRITSLQQISNSLVAAGYTSLDSQAKALGVRRSTAWTIVNAKHKLGRLSAKTTNRILANPELPAPVRAAVRQYLDEADSGL